MSKIVKTQITTGVYWIEIPEADLYVLCGCPADSIKHLMKAGKIRTIEKDCIYNQESTSDQTISTVACETGPNAILLSDLSIQNGQFTNLAEFPVLQMLYRQGMLLPNHPNNTGAKPLIIGREDVVRAQMDYIYRGNYGLISVEEIMETGISKEEAQEMMRLKLRFAFGEIRPSSNLLESRIIDTTPVELLNGVFVTRTDTNRFDFMYRDEHVSVDLYLQQHQYYEPPYVLENQHFKREYFSVIHTGEGDGWDTKRPCMASVVCFQGKIYLIDVGPNIAQSLSSMGIDVNEVEGIFHTHGHDDHFAGLTTLIRADHKIKYYSTPLVRASVTKKLASLMSIEESSFKEFFDVHDLIFDEWNDINGLEVKPVFSPHPLETNILFFRAFWNEGYSSYAHLADLTSLNVLEGMINENPDEPGISQKMYETVRQNYLTPANVKKIDIGGGMIHGQAVDFREDRSDKIILAHTNLEITEEEKEIGCDVSFGSTDVLIEGEEDYCLNYALNFLKEYFPTTDINELHMLLNCDRKFIEAGSILLNHLNSSDHVYLILTGVAELFVPNENESHIISSGSFIGDMPAIFDYKNKGTYKALSHIEVLIIPAEIFKEFVTRNNLFDQLKKLQNTLEFLQEAWLFCESISSPIQSKIAQHMNLKEYKKGEKIEYNGLMLIKEGRVEIGCNNCNEFPQILFKGDFWGEDTVLHQKDTCCLATASVAAKVYEFTDIDLFNKIPIIRWKMLERKELRKEVIAGRTKI